ncbi:DUF2279 domain-containing protein [Marivirga sp. S37H4]|uniref:DUF2279 domain-containing protein n=1 Tax=Marivirga aurantiaca TaxID=2802615 RepID=A0A935CBU3_9BACT|nr:DUF2279 domain-containing protein [Marivirga aurantiaca]MBK6266997.1 DUF2279 domain-containing protein [Marivirga aurantiaca]
MGLLLACQLICLDLYSSNPHLISDSSKVNKKRLALVVGAEAAFYTAGMLYLSEVWYSNDQAVPFHFYKDQTGWLQMDKFAHSYVAYYESYAGYHALRWSGLSKTKALWFGGTLGFVLQLPVEVFDGLYEGYGFSLSDVVANGFGSALFMAQQHFWDEQKIIPKFSFYPSAYAEIRPGTLGRTFGEQLVQDYNAQTYWYSFSPAAFMEKSNWPEWLCFSLGYSGAGMLSEFENPEFIYGESVEHIERYRQYYLSMDVDLRKIKTNSVFLKGVFQVLNIIKIPAPAIEFNRINGIEFHPLHY